MFLNVVDAIVVVAFANVVAFSAGVVVDPANVGDDFATNDVANDVNAVANDASRLLQCFRLSFPTENQSLFESLLQTRGS